MLVFFIQKKKKNREQSMLWMIQQYLLKTLHTMALVQMHIFGRVSHPDRVLKDLLFHIQMTTVDRKFILF